MGRPRVIGDEARFAIEFALDDEPAGEWLNGNVKLWVAGRSVGERPATDLVSLRDYIGIFDYTASGAGRRSNEGLFQAPVELAVGQLNSVLFTGCDASLDARALDEQWGLLWLHLGFPSATVFAIEHEDQLRLLVSERGTARELVLPAREVYGVFECARDELESLLQQFRTSYP